MYYLQNKILNIITTTIIIITLFHGKSRMNLIIINIKHSVLLILYFAFPFRMPLFHALILPSQQRCGPGELLSLFHLLSSAMLCKVRNTSTGFWFQKWGKQTQKQSKKPNWEQGSPHSTNHYIMCLLTPLFHSLLSSPSLLRVLTVIISHLVTDTTHTVHPVPAPHSHSPQENLPSLSCTGSPYPPPVTVPLHLCVPSSVHPIL